MEKWIQMATPDKEADPATYTALEAPRSAYEPNEAMADHNGPSLDGRI